MTCETHELSSMIMIQPICMCCTTSNKQVCNILRIYNLLFVCVQSEPTESKYFEAIHLSESLWTVTLENFCPEKKCRHLFILNTPIKTRKSSKLF